MPWMRKPIADAVKAGILTPIDKVCVSKDEENTYNEGFVFERSKEILTPGHPAVFSTNMRIEKVAERSTFSNYIVPPNKFSFDKTVRIIGLVFRFVRSFKCRKGKVKKVD